MTEDTIVLINGTEIRLRSASMLEIVSAISEHPEVEVTMDHGKMTFVHRHEVAIPVAIEPIKRPSGFDWRARQAQVPRNGKRKTQWSRRFA